MNTNKMILTIEAKSQNESFARSVVAAFFSQLNPTMEQIEDIKTAVSEAVTNSIVHGYQGSQKGKIEIKCMLNYDEMFLQVQIVDYGKGIDDVQKGNATLLYDSNKWRKVRHGLYGNASLLRQGGSSISKWLHKRTTTKVSKIGDKCSVTKKQSNLYFSHNREMKALYQPYYNKIHHL